jgi:hypothetical protein
LKNKAGIFLGFIIGFAGFLFLFKILFLDRIPPSDELAPGIVMFIALMSGVLFAFIGYSVQNYYANKNLH